VLPPRHGKGRHFKGDLRIAQCDEWDWAKGGNPVRASEDTAIKALLIVGAAVRINAGSDQA